MARYVVVVDGETPEQRNALTQFVKGSGAGYWHWVGPAWLIVDTAGRDEIWWRESFRKLLPVSANIIVINADTASYAAFSPAGSHKWLDETWMSAKRPSS
jgi:hypothetical protein